MIERLRKKIGGDYPASETRNTVTIPTFILEVLLNNADELALWREGYQPDEDEDEP